MPYTIVPITKYQLYVRAGSSRHWPSRAALALYEEAPIAPPGGRTTLSLRGLARFTDETPLPPVTFGGSLTLWYPTSMFDAILTMLREEKPIFLIHNQDYNLADLATDPEPVGEEEGLSG